MTTSNRAVLSVHTKPETRDKLDALARVTNRSKSFLANEAIEIYLKEEESFVASVQRGLADADAGRVHTTEEARKHIKKFVHKTKSA